MDGGSAGKLRSANLDGTGVEDLLTGLVVPRSIALTFGGGVSTGVSPEEVFPNGVELRGNYPNPVQGSTTIEFSLTEPTYVTLEIYDQLGRRVEVLASETHPPGSFYIRWNTAGLANGVYFCRMETENGAETIQLVLQR